MARTVGHNIDRYVGHKLLLAERQERRYRAHALHFIGNPECVQNDCEPAMVERHLGDSPDDV